jgi:uncharacterized protein YkwD
MSMPDASHPLRPPHPARHLFGTVGLIISTILILGGFFAAALYVSTVLTGGGMAAVISSALVELTNEDREAKDLHALSVNPALVAAAQAKADHMAGEGYFAHVAPDGTTPWKWFADAGYEYSAAGENLAVNFSDSENVEEAWMNSPSHRANILSARFTEIGIATASGEYKGKKTTFVVQMFGAPRTLSSGDETPLEVTPSTPEDIAIVVRGEPAILGSEASSTIPGVVSSEPAQEETPPVARVAVVPLVTPVERAMVSPENILRAVYLVCGLVVLLALLLTTRLELRRHHIRHVAAAAFLLVLLGGTMALADRIIFTPPIIAEAAGN